MSCKSSYLHAYNVSLMNSLCGGGVARATRHYMAHAAVMEGPNTHVQAHSCNSSARLCSTRIIRSHVGIDHCCLLGVSAFYRICTTQNLQHDICGHEAPLARCGTASAQRKWGFTWLSVHIDAPPDALSNGSRRSQVVIVVNTAAPLRAVWRPALDSEEVQVGQLGRFTC